jgi:1-aminocyclopropane-1-carboxylate deaminase
METIRKFPKIPLCLSSRIHPLKTFKNTWIKRDDELMYGTKTRKFATLIPFLKTERRVGLLGGKYSNNLVGLSQLCIQNGIEPILYLNGEKEKPIGNHLLIHLIVKPENIHYIPHGDYARIVSEKQPHMMIPEGANHIYAFYGLFTLVDDILRNESENNIKIDNIYIDSGTGMSAISLILGLSLLGRFDIKVHVLQLGKLDFSSELHRFKSSLMETKSMEKLIPFDVTTVNGFTKGKSDRFKYIQTFCRDEGILLDPLYSCNLFPFVQKSLENTIGTNLVIHSGGTQALFGFQDQLYQISNVAQTGL